MYWCPDSRKGSCVAIQAWAIPELPIPYLICFTVCCLCIVCSVFMYMYVIRYMMTWKQWMLFLFLASTSSIFWRFNTPWRPCDVTVMSKRIHFYWTELKNNRSFSLCHHVLKGYVVLTPIHLKLNSTRVSIHCSRKRNIHCYSHTYAKSMKTVRLRYIFNASLYIGKYHWFQTDRPSSVPLRSFHN